MRILQVVPSYAPAWGYGGPTRVVYELSRALQRRGHEVTVYTTDAFLPVQLDASLEEHIEENIRVVRLRNVNRRAAERNQLFWPRELGPFAHSELSPFDVIHIHDFRIFYNSVLRRAARRAGVPYVLSPHGSAPFNGQRKTVKLLFDFVIGNKLLRDAAALLALTETEASNLAQILGTSARVHVIPNAVHIPAVASPAAKADQRIKWGITDNRRIILYFGRIDRSKRIDILLRSFNCNSTCLDSVHLVVCGPDFGAAHELLSLADQLGIASRVTFAEPIYSEEKHIAIQAADVLVIPRFSGLPLVLLEAAANSRPAVTTSQGSGLRWLDGSGGIVTDPEPEALGAALSHILSADTARSMGAKARAGVELEYSWNSVAMEYENRYAAVIYQQETHAR